MVERTLRPLAALALGAICLASIPLTGLAQTSTYYTPPKMVKQGTANSPVVGTGAVTVLVFVKKDGSVGAA
jgi:hypothetical protein